MNNWKIEQVPSDKQGVIWLQIIAYSIKKNFTYKKKIILSDLSLLEMYKASFWLVRL